jgi:HAD superfamily hydrolase (TIGR01509 family)
MPGMADLVRSLSERYRLLLLSNVDSYYWEVVRSMHPELGYFDTVLLSCELGLAKPEPAIFRRASQVAAVAPQQCLFIDDTGENVTAARALGFRAHQFRDIGALRQDLRQAGITGA